MWYAPPLRDLLHTRIHLPGSKSETNRALVLSLIAHEPTVIHSALDAEDTRLMVGAIEELGAQVSWDKDDLRVVPPSRIQARTGKIECGLAGTVMRFLAPVAALSCAPVRFDGTASARKRPMAGLLDALEEGGISIEYEGEVGHVPFRVCGQGFFPSTTFHVDAAASSQYISALLIGAATSRGLVDVYAHTLPSMPHVLMTVEALRERGISVQYEHRHDMHHWRVIPAHVRGGEFFITPDLTNAGPFLAAAVLGGEVTIEHWPDTTVQPGKIWPQLLGDMGAHIVHGDHELTIRRPHHLHGIDYSMAEYGELVPTVAALAACAQTPSRLRHIGHLRGHETDRLHALVISLRALGAGAYAHGDDLIIHPAPLRPATLWSFGDHRMAMFGAIIGLIVPGVVIDGIEATAKTFPQFPRLWENMVNNV